ncbi:aminopeptidase P family N-terminal domain-containing protein, partial [Rhizobiaceae sp. 2RAB30]
LAAAHLKKLGAAGKRIGIEPAFLPLDAYQAIVRELGQPEFVDATDMLERMRAIKTEAELDQLRLASEKITDSMLAVFASQGEGASKQEIVEALR